MSTRIDEIGDGVYRISTAVPPQALPGGFTFNQYLVLDEEPLLYHTGPRATFAPVRAAIERVLPVSELRHLAFSHFEADECGALNGFLEAAPRATPLCGEVAAMVSIDDFASRPSRRMADGEEVVLGRRTVRWIATPHLPHAWECGHLLETTTRTLFCGDLFTQGGDRHPPLTEGDILGPSEAMRSALDYFSHSRHTPRLIERLAGESPTTLACMHGAAWQGDGASLLRALGRSLVASG
jgi:flavorubredoxin